MYALNLPLSPEKEEFWECADMKERCDVRVQKNEAEDEGAVFLDEIGETREEIDFKVQNNTYMSKIRL